MPFLIALYNCLFAHLNVTKDYEDGKKLIAYSVFTLIAVVYAIFRLIF